MEPQSTDLMDSMATELYWQTVADGKYKVAYGRVMLIGGPSVGKSSLKRALMGRPMLDRMDSTIMADLEPMTIGVSSADREMDRQWIDAAAKWKEVTEKEEIDELALLLKQTYDTRDDAEGLSMAANDLFEVPEDLGPTPEVPDSEIKEVQKMSVAKKLKKAVERIDSIDEHMQPSPFVHLWDSGGQPLFREILPTFLTSRTLFILMFDASRGLDENVTTGYYYDGCHVSGEASNITTLDLITKWMASIHLYLAKHHGKRADFPRILLVGSHGDEVKDPLAVSALKQKLIEHFKGNPSADLLLHGLKEKSIKIIDNTTSGTDKEDEQIGEIRRDVHDFITEKLGVTTPVSWILFRKVISDEKIIDLAKATAIGRACKIRPEEIPRVLLFYHELGVLLFYPHIEGLRNIIITDPRWFVQQIGEVLTLHGRESQSIAPTTWHLLQTTGILVEPLYQEAWEKSGFDPQSLMNLLVHFRIAAEVETDRFHLTNIKEYFVPAVLKPCPSGAQGAVRQKYHSRAAPLHITFRMKYVPPGFFTRLITTLLTSANFQLIFEAPEGIFQNCVSLCYGRRAWDHVTITELQSVIEVIVQRFTPAERLKPFHLVCQELLVLLEGSCWAVNQMLLHKKQTQEGEQSIMHGMRFAKPEIRNVCMSCHDDVHYISQHGDETSEDQFVCEKNKDYRPLLPQEKYWFKCDETPDKIEASSADLNDQELFFIAKELESRVDELAAHLRMADELKNIQCDDHRKRNMTYELLIVFRRNCAYARTALAEAVLFMRETRLSEKIKFEDGVVPSKKSLNRPLEIQHTDSLAPLTFDVPSISSTPTLETQQVSAPVDDGDIIFVSKFISNSDASEIATLIDITKQELIILRKQFEQKDHLAIHLLKRWRDGSTPPKSKEDLKALLQGSLQHIELSNLLMEAPADRTADRLPQRPNSPYTSRCCIL